MVHREEPDGEVCLGAGNFVDLSTAGLWFMDKKAVLMLHRLIEQRKKKSASLKGPVVEVRGLGLSIRVPAVSQAARLGNGVPSSMLTMMLRSSWGTSLARKFLASAIVAIETPLCSCAPRTEP